MAWKKTMGKASGWESGQPLTSGVLSIKYSQPHCYFNLKKLQGFIKR